MSKISILKTGITNLDTDVIVNPANEALRERAGVCGMIFKAAGSSELQAACDAIGSCQTGSAVITPGFNLKSKFVIHAVGPRWMDGNHNEPQLLYSAYMQSLLLAVRNGCKSIGFPLISAGVYGYPVDKAWRKALQACLDFQSVNPDADLDIQFAVINDGILAVGRKILLELRKVRTTLFLKELDDDGLQRIRERLSSEKERLIDRNVHPMASGLMDVLCDSMISSHLSADHMMKMINSIYPEYVLEEGWIIRYCDLLLHALGDVEKSKPYVRAKKYEEHLRNVLIPRLREGAHSDDVLDDLETLKDIYKVTACLHRYYSRLEKEFFFTADRESLKSLFEGIMKVNNTGGYVLGLPLAQVKIEEKQYATFLSWIIEELVISDEEMKVGEK